ncbi:Variant surface glycoprotein [Trypanosoma congolense IL3000]|uniref:Variant surface glycoprotein n=1 Tax=Trypanosoma congolense (strain IL3000) TaxID=1068625 RepID=F9W7D2_TRYCI|nr:Variant surface glycoprotein [Trypanosoma congolense IL3000]
MMIRKIQLWMIVCFMVMGVVRAMVSRGPRGRPYRDGSDFNGFHYDYLCDVFQATAELWEASMKSQKVPNDELQGALDKALFGNYGKRDIQEITETLPDDYKQLRNRKEWCGSCKNSERYYPGRSITHDLMCLCAPGYYGEPFYIYYWSFGWYYEETGYKLCHKGRTEMVNNQYEGWYAYKGYGQNKGLEKSWKTVVWGCLNNRKDKGVLGGQNIEEKLKKLNTTIWNFTGILRHANGRHKLGGYDDHYTASDGSDEKRIHVHYDTCDQLKKPWWKKLQEALEGKTETQLLVDRSTVTKTQEPLAPPPEEKGETMLTAGDDVPIIPPDNEVPTESTITPEEEGNGTQVMTPSDGLSNTSTKSTGPTIRAMEGNHSAHFQYLRSSTTITRPLCLLSTSFLI